MTKRIEKLLVANRGEIAVRIFRAAREMGIATVAVYSETDRDALHTRFADEAFLLGETAPSASYLNITRVVEVALKAGADAVHPGYGFLAENPDLAVAVTDAGLVWVGPPPDAVRSMGDKVEARRTAAEADVGSVPGSLEPIDGPEAIERFASEHGWPVALKAAHGGGGRGFRVVGEAKDAASAFESAGREAETAFGSPALYLERYLENPRHIEVQVIGDTQGNLVHLGERECSLQRRHQKLIEESPSPVVDDNLRAEMGEAAVRVASAAGYHSAGTVEFLVDETDSGQRFYFLEMNTRLQVEHPVTEWVCGIDLVKEMIRVAQGERLSFKQEDVAWRGHAVECRINAENPARNFIPNPGLITAYREPGGPGVRVDSGVVEGAEIPQAYDSLIAKLVCWGADRDEAIARMARALREFEIEGVRTTIPFHIFVMESDWFSRGEFSTKTVERDLDLSELPVPEPKKKSGGAIPSRHMTLELEGKRFEVTVTEDPQASRTKPEPPDLGRSKVHAGAGETITAPMQGTIVKTLVDVGDMVKAGDGIAVLEAMKMENLIPCHRDGVVKELNVEAGQTVPTGSTIAVIGPPDTG